MESGERLDLLVVVDRHGQPREYLERMSRGYRGSYVTQTKRTVGVKYRVGPMAPKVVTIGQTQAFLLGHAVCEDPISGDVVSEMVRLLQAGDLSGFARMQGVYALVVVDWDAACVQVVSDLLGTRPLYWSEREGTNAIADRALALARLGPMYVDLRGLASWLVFKIALGDDTLFENVKRVPPASVGRFENGKVLWNTYWEPISAEEEINEEELYAILYDNFRASVSRLLAPHNTASVLLSGGFDSRFILLTALSHTHTRIKAVTVPYNNAERRVVNRLAKLLDLPVKRSNVRGSILDAFDSLWHNHPDGYMLMRNLTYLPVDEHPELEPFLDGWLGAQILGDCHGVLPAFTPSWGEILEWFWRHFAQRFPDLAFRPRVVQRIREQAQEALEAQARVIKGSTKPCYVLNLLTRQRRFFTNNFVQYQHLALSLHPFYNRTLIERRLRHNNNLFKYRSYRQMLARRFPGAGGLPHAADLPIRWDAHEAYSRRLQRLLPTLARFVADEKRIFRTGWVLSRLSAYGFGYRQQKYVVEEVARMAALQQYLRRRGVRVSYSDLFAL